GTTGARSAVPRIADNTAPEGLPDNVMVALITADASFSPATGISIVVPAGTTPVRYRPDVNVVAPSRTVRLSSEPPASEAGRRSRASRTAIPRTGAPGREHVADAPSATVTVVSDTGNGATVPAIASGPNANYETPTRS